MVTGILGGGTQPNTYTNCVDSSALLFESCHTPFCSWLRHGPQRVGCRVLQHRCPEGTGRPPDWGKNISRLHARSSTWFTWKIGPRKRKGDPGFGNYHFQVRAVKLWGCKMGEKLMKSHPPYVRDWPLRHQEVPVPEKVRVFQFSNWIISPEIGGENKKTKPPLVTIYLE